MCWETVEYFVTRLASASEPLLGIQIAFCAHQIRDQAGPSRLMARADPRSVIAVEILVEQQVVAPVRIVLKRSDAAEYRALPVLVA